MGDIINLRNVRKQIVRAKKETKAAENRVVFGKTKSERQKAEAEKALESSKLDGHKLDE